MSDEQIPTPEATPEAAPAAPAPGTPEYNQAMAARGIAAMEGVPEKFTNVDGTVNMEAFTKSYREMERQFHAKAEEPAAEAPAADPEAAPEAPAEEVKTPDALQIEEPAPEPAPEADAEPSPIPGISEEKYGEWKGEIMRGGLSDESRAELAALGFNDTIINDFVAAQKAHLRAGMERASSVVGGQENLSEIFGWASNNLDVAAREQINAGLAGPAWEVTLRGLEAQYESAKAARPKAAEMTHKATAANPAGQETLRGFASMVDFQAQRGDPRYGRDARFTDQTNQRAAMTDWTKIR